jgi:4-amino-4-deoxy-L-arabinose transferase-like glycosyltransferase
MKVFNWFKTHILLIILIAVFGFFFFYRLDYNTLASWDEGWYASIARNIARTGDFMRMMWNGKPYYDHPPMGFWLMALSYKLFGINEFATRFPSAVLGLLSIILVYKIGIELFGKKIIGFIAAIILGTSVWYLIRVRSGDLDSVFVFFYILTMYLSIRSSKNFKWFPLVGLSFGGLILSKTLVGISALVLILFLNLKQFFKKEHILYLVLGIGGFFILVFPWYKIQANTYGDFIQHHFFTIGMRDKTLKSYFNIMLDKPFFYLHMGVRKWYYIWLLVTGYLVISLKFLKKNILFLFLWNFVILYPFLTSEKTELWHLIPTYVPMAFIIAVGAYEGALFVQKKIKIVPQNLYVVAYAAFFILLAGIQAKIFIPEVYPQSRYIPDDVAISKAAQKYDKIFYLDDDYTPLAVFYADRIVYQLSYEPGEKKTLLKLFQSPEKDFIVATRNWALNHLDEEKIPYKILEQNNLFTIATRP